MESVVKEGLTGRLKERLLYHVVDTTAILTPTNPLFAAMEVGISGMSDDVSIRSRLTIAALSYGGMGSLYAKGRDFSRRIFHIGDNSSERLQALPDSTYTFAFNILAMPPIYLSMGADLKQAAIGSLSGAVLGMVTGPLMGYSIDVARDLVGLRECNRDTYPYL